MLITDITEATKFAVIQGKGIESMWGSSTVRGCSTPIYFTYLLETQVILFLDWNFPSTANCFELR